MSDPLYSTVTAMIAPALFLTATASLIVSTANRMGRIIDRIRKLLEQGNQIATNVAGYDFPEARLRHIDLQLDNLQARNRRVLLSVTELYLAFGSFVGTSLAIAVDSFAGHRLPVLPTAFAVAGVVLLLAASLGLVLEARTALRTSHLEVDFYRELTARRLQAAKADATLPVEPARP